MKKTSIRSRLESRSTQVALAMIAILLVAVAIAWAGYDDTDHLPDGTTEGSWIQTGYSNAQSNTCNASIGEICKEWCITTPNGHDIGTGELCCVIGQQCRSPRP